MSKKPTVLISCGIFEEELRYLLRERGLEGDVVLLDAALHVNFDRLETQLKEALEQYRTSGAELKVLYGRCHPRIMEILAPYGARKLAASNCLEAMIGAEEMKRLNREGTAFFLSAGWVAHWERMFETGKEDFGFDFTTFFTSYKRIIVLDTGVLPLDEEKVQRFSNFTGLPVERKKISLDPLLHLIQNID
jgi:hypothetical protein